MHVIANHLEGEDGKSAFYVEEIINHGFDSKIKFYRAYSRLILKRILYNCIDSEVYSFEPESKAKSKPPGSFQLYKILFNINLEYAL